MTKPVGKGREAPKKKQTHDALPSYAKSRITMASGSEPSSGELPKKTLTINPVFVKKEKITIDAIDESDDGRSVSLGSSSLDSERP